MDLGYLFWTHCTLSLTVNLLLVLQKIRGKTEIIITTHLCRVLLSVFIFQQINMLTFQK